MSETETYEQSDDHSSSTEVEVQRRSHKGGKDGHHRLLGEDACLQGKNENVPKEVVRGS